MLFMGVGGSWSPDVPRLDVLISERLKARGFAGSRDESICLYASTIIEQATEYARRGDHAFMRVLEPGEGCVLSWVPGNRDLVLRLQDHLSSMFWGGIGSYNGVKFGALVRDTQGDIQTIETYLSMGRLKRQIGAIVDSLLDQIEVVEVVMDGTTDIASLLSDHRGEVWLTGQCAVREYDPCVDCEISARDPAASLKV